LRSFNFGVDFGQSFVIAVAFLIVGWFRRKPWFRARITITCSAVLAGSAMQQYVDSFFASPNFMPHGMCYLWHPGTLWLNVSSDGLIAAAYYAIPIALYNLVHERRKEIPFPGIILMFAAFIVLCGTTHLMEIWTVWHPDYRVAGALKALTGIAARAGRSP